MGCPSTALLLGVALPLMGNIIFKNKNMDVVFYISWNRVRGEIYTMLKQDSCPAAKTYVLIRVTMCK